MFSLNGDPIALAVLGLGGLLLGLAELGLSRVRRLRTWKVSLALVALLALAGGVVYACDRDSYLWQPTLVLAGVALALLLFRSPTSIAGRPIVQGAGLVLLGGALLASQLYRLDQNLENELLYSDVELAQMTDPIDENSPPALVATTDTGRSIPLFSPNLALPTAEQEARNVQDLCRQAKLIQTAPSENRYNCHGWVFAEGRYWVRSKMVDTILQDNAYQLVEKPRAGDVAVFRNLQGEVTHSGLVRASEKDGQILIESKWGRFGRYLHTPEWHGYRADKVTYYRSSRGSHVLKSFDYARPESATGG
jgi:hypothetical protein